MIRVNLLGVERQKVKKPLLAIDPTHSKTLLNIGVVRAFGKQDLEGAAKAWERVLEVAPNSAEAARAKQGLDGIRSAHPEAGRGGGRGAS